MKLTFTVDPLPCPLRSPFLVLRGERHPTVAVIEVNGDSDGTVYPTPTSWEHHLHLVPGPNTIAIQGEDAAGNRSEVLLVEAELRATRPVIDFYFNPLDDLGAEVMVERLPGEKNVYLRNRILDAEEHLGNATYAGLVRALSRELSLDTTEDVLTLTPIEDESSRLLRANSVFITIEPTRVLVEATELRRSRERLRIDPGSGEGTLAEVPTSKDELVLESRSGRRLEPWEYDLGSGPDGERRVWVKGEDRELFASYPYLARIDLSSGMTVASLASALESLTGISGQSLLSAEVAAGYEGALAARLVRVVREGVSRDGLSLLLARLQVTPLADPYYQASLLNGYGTYFGTRLEAYAERTREKGRAFFQDTILDRDRLIDFDPDQRLGVLPHLFDPVLRHHRCSDPTDERRYTDRDVKRGGGVCPRHPGRSLSLFGLRGSEIRSGPGSSLRMVGVS